MTIIVADILFLIGSLTMGLAPTVGVLMMGRLVVGLGVGLAAMVVPVYLAEQSPKEIRGRMVAVNILFVTSGQFISILLCVALKDQW